MEIRFFVLIRGARTPPPMIEEPVMKIPLGCVRLGCNERKRWSTKQLQRLIIQCRVRYLNLPRREVICLREIVRSVSKINDHSQIAINRRTYIESFSIPSEEHICVKVSLLVNQASPVLHAPTTVNAVVAPPRPYLKLILTAKMKLDW